MPPTAVWRSPTGLARAVTALLCFVVLTDLAAMGALLNMRALMTRLEGKPFATFTEAEGERADLLVAMTSSLQIVAFVATVVVFIIWFHRVRRNAEVFAPDLLTRGPGWAIGSWFIPVANLWIPRGIAAQVWTASRTFPYSDDDHEPRRPVNLWWTAHLVAWFSARPAARRYEAAETPEEIVSAVDALLVAEVFDIIAAALAVHFVLRLTGMQRARAQERGQGTAVGAGPAVAPAHP